MSYTIFKRDYEAMKMAKLRKKHPGMENEELMRYFGMGAKMKPPKSAAQFEALITEYVHMKGGISTKVSVMGRSVVKKTKVTDVVGRKNTIIDETYIPSTTKKGTSDLILSYKNHVLYTEVKFSKTDRQSEDQKKFEAHVVKSGSQYRIVKTLDDFCELWMKFTDWVNERELILKKYRYEKIQN